MQTFKIAPFTGDLIPQVQAFADLWCGEGYFDRKELEAILEMSNEADSNCSFVAFCGDEVAAIRLSFGPGKWLQKARGTSPDQWRVPQEKAAYFKSLFVADKFQKQGLGKSLSGKSIEALKRMGAQAIVCHSWLESPGNSSQKYLKSMGFEAVKEHRRFWYPIDYLCSRCAPERCECTAIEMIKYL